MSPDDEKILIDLRVRASVAIQRDLAIQASPLDLSAEELLHELRLHHVELEMQNEALRNAQDALAVSRDKYIDLYEFAPVGYITISADGLIEQLNLTATSLLGTDRKNLLTKRFAGLVVAEDRDRWTRLFLGMKRYRERGSLELVLQSGDGTLFDALLDCSPRTFRTVGDKVERDFAESPGAIWIVLTDITKRKKAETIARQSAAFNVAILDSISASVAVLDEDAKIIAVNHTWRQFGIDNNREFKTPNTSLDIGANYLAACSDDAGYHAVAARDGILAVLDRTLPSFSLEYPCDSPSQQRWFNMTVTPLALDDAGVVVTHTDITAQKNSEKQIIKLGQAVDQSPECIVITNLEAQIEYVNDAFVETTGYHREEIIGRNPRFLQSGKTPPENYAALWDALTNGRPWHGELFNRHKDGTEFIEFARIAPIRHADGKITHYLAIKENITERKRIETKLAESENDLRIAREDAHDSLTAFAAEQIRFIEAERKRLAREVHDQIGQVFTAIKLIINSIPRDAFPSGQEEAIAQALEMGIATTRKISSELRPPLLDDLGLAAALDHLSKKSAGLADISYKIDIGAQDSLNSSQCLTLFRITQEAITNILRHAAATHFVITGRKDGIHYVFCIEDNGCGITVADSRGGSMGLTNMRERASLIGGSCEISIMPQGGTRVTVYLLLDDQGPDEYSTA